ncbi:MAG: imidazole glycerol phosphate synthase subunit HisH [Elusimicrobia bacterium]|nr:imidazole glycerol phosphate synthase subunit HisH [Elusimicrobiota bacterium]
MKLVVVDYGLGNLYNLGNAFARCGRTVEVSHDPAVLRAADALILPGVGAFGDGKRRLEALGLDAVIRSAAEAGAAILGICLGMQLLMDTSEEFGLHQGLGLIAGEVLHFHSHPAFDRSAKVPHMGWNDILPQREHPLLRGLAAPDMYFVHSYYARAADASQVLATARYGGVEFCSVVGRGRILGCQFHPEKSSASGLRLIENFIGMIEDSL